MTGLFDLLEHNHIQATAIVGMTKNVGKTVTLNFLVKEFEHAGVAIGLVSAGYDGERFDRLTLKDKPRIYAPEGSFIATAKACFEAADARLELIEKSTYSTPLGEVYLARVERAGLVELAGPGSVSGLKKLVASMASYGAEHVLVDGAINRLASASPLLTEGTVLATGAALGPTMEDVVRKTLYRKELMESPGVEEQALLDAAKKGLESGKAVLIHRQESDYLVEPVRAMIPLIAGSLMVDKCRQDTAALVYGGALVDNNLQDVMELYPRPPAVIVHDPTKIFLSSQIYYRYLNQGGKLMVLNTINLLAVTLNPTDPFGRGYDPQIFLETMKEALSPCPVYDLVLESK